MTATTFQGLEETLAGELRALGAGAIRPMRRAVSFTGDQRMLYRANCCLRTAIRVLKPIRTFAAPDERALYAGVRQIDWTKLMSTHDTLAVNAVAFSRQFRNSQFAALKVKDAVVDQFRERFGKRPSVDTGNPTLRINIHVHETRCTLSLDSSGELLHRRGYRLGRGPAPLNEALAAGMILISGWSGDTPFVDPMCGAGTIPIEAAMIRDNIAPGLLRREFGFMRWRDFDERLWIAVLDEARRAVRRQAAPVLGCDINGNAIRHAIENAARAGLERRVTFAPRGVDQVEPPPGPGVAVINPPYGVRIGGNVDTLYTAIGDRLKKAFTGYDVWILSANKDALKRIGLRASSRKTLFNGPMQCAFWRYRMYEGSIKKSKQRRGRHDASATG